MPTNNQNQNNQNGPTAMQTLQVFLEFFWVLIQLTYFNIEAIVRWFVPPPKKSVNGEIVLVTGAGHGIGKEFAMQYAALGATVIAWDVNEQNNLKTVKEINRLGYPKAYSYVCDVSNREKVFETVEKVRKDVGDITIIVNNAGIMPTHSLLEHTQKEIEAIFDINVLGHFWIIQAIMPSMLKRNHGHIVSISSCAGLSGLENLVPYCASKFAVRGYMEALRMELELIPNCQVKLTTIYPYMVDTGLCKKPIIRFAEAMTMLTPYEVAATAIDGQMRGVRHVSVPRLYWYMNNYFRMNAEKGMKAMKEFLGVSLGSDLS
ncbi:17-beta-hydroxysteroid dehydrogenase 13 [Onthophagus taurus]|uniref:17-beta-hydroxysteroid dehydrogenase 13 n=1 Tax=Onthophagus taurus TaxID=166361 RepID=UPI000C208BFB|nr:17-beta-hydroxysteroid dehydrogenase 13 [Onthophagus taurus]